MNLCLFLVLGALAFEVMPDGPWYRQVLAAVLISWASDVRRDSRTRQVASDPEDPFTILDLR